MGNSSSAEMLCTYCQAGNSGFNPVCKQCGKDLPLLSLSGSLEREAHSQGLDAGVASAQKTLPTHLGRYELKRCLHQTRHSQVYEGEDSLMRRQVAIKAHLQAQPHETWRVDFLKEARALAALNHPAITQIYDCLQHEEFSCLVMEWVDGKPLNASHLQTSEHFCHVVDQIFGALDLAHGVGLIHRDLKPDHLLVTGDNHLKMIDFGLVKRVGAAKDSLPSTPGQGFWRGTPAYMSPEQIAGEPLDWRSDMFSLALVLAELLYGKHPFASQNLAVVLHQISHGEPVLTGATPAWVSPRIAKVLRKALAKQPTKRWSSLGEFRSELLVGLPERTSGGN